MICGQLANGCFFFPCCSVSPSHPLTLSFSLYSIFVSISLPHSWYHLHCWVQPHRRALGHRGQRGPSGHLSERTWGRETEQHFAHKYTILHSSSASSDEHTLFAFSYNLNWLINSWCSCCVRKCIVSAVQSPCHAISFHDDRGDRHWLWGAALHWDFASAFEQSAVFFPPHFPLTSCFSPQSKTEPFSQGEYNVYSTFQSHEPEFDYLKSLEIEEKINKIRWLPQQNAAHFLLSTNGERPKKHTDILKEPRR